MFGFSRRHDELDPETRARLYRARRRHLARFQRVERRLGSGLQVILGVALMGVLAIGALMLTSMDEGSIAQGGLVYFGVFFLIVAVALGRAFMRNWAGRSLDDGIAGRLEHALGHEAETRLVSEAAAAVAPPTSDELDHVSQMMALGSSLEDACRLARRGFAWLEPRQRAAYVRAVRDSLPDLERE